MSQTRKCGECGVVGVYEANSAGLKSAAEPQLFVVDLRVPFAREGGKAVHLWQYTYMCN